MTSRTNTRRGQGAGGWVAAVLLVAAAGTPGCYTAQMTQMTGALDTLRLQVAELNARDSVSARTLEDTRRELTEQRDMLAATRATASSTARQTDETLGRLEGKLDDIMARFRIATERQPARQADPPPAQPPSGGTMPPSTHSTGGPAPTQAYDQATTDLTQGRYAMALTGYREFLKRFPEHDLADNAQYGAGECFFAQSQFDSALVEYARVGATWGRGDRAPASLYKLGLCEERLGRNADARRSFEDLVARFPQSGEAQLARDRISKR